MPAAFQPKWNGRLELKIIFLVSSIHSGELEALVFTRFDVVNSFHNFPIKISLFSFVHDIKLGGQFSVLWYIH